MKYIKKFNESVNSETLLDIREILLDFTDSGNEINVDWVDSRYKHEIVVIIKNKTENLDLDTFIRLFSYMKDLGFKCNYIFCQSPIKKNLLNGMTVTHRLDSSDKIYIMQSAKDFGLDWDIKSINSWSVLELVFHKMK